MKLFSDTFHTPLGLFSIAVDENGALAATAFGDRDALRQRVRADTSASRCDLIDDTGANAHSRARRAAREQILAWFAGKRRNFALPLAPRGTPFQQRVWSALAEIPFGETLTYGRLAAQLGNRSASRAVGRANATNPVCLIVPCHRVIGADGSLTGFAFGEDIKRRLLEHERAGLSWAVRERLPSEPSIRPTSPPRKFPRELRSAVA